MLEENKYHAFNVVLFNSLFAKKYTVVDLIITNYAERLAKMI